MKKTLWISVLIAGALTGCGENAQLDVSDIRQEVEAKAKIPETYTPKIVGDVTAGQQIARQCVLCHGLDGAAARSGSPFIAGVPQDYLIRSILAYGDGSRKHADMKRMAEALSPQDLENVTAYYASLDTPWKGAVVQKNRHDSLVTPQAIAAGAALASGCNSCHGENGHSTRQSIIPSLAGMPPEYFIPTLKGYFTGIRAHGVMKMFSKSLTDNDINHLAAYYASRAPIQAPPPRKGNAAAGKRAAQACAGCHGYNGNSLNPHVPNLAGLPAEYISKAIKDYRDGRRRDELMTGAVRGLSNDVIIDLATYYGKQVPESKLQRQEAATMQFDPVAEGEKIASSCIACHGEDGNSLTAGVPSLTGLHVKYLVAATQAYQEGARKSNVMATMISHLSDTDIEKVSYYFATRATRIRQATQEGDPLSGEKTSENCASCHGAKGVSSDPANPSLAGQDAKYLFLAIREYAGGKRAHEGMKNAVAELSEQDMRNVAAYYAAQTAVQPQTFLPELPAMIIEKKCNRCHGASGHSTEAGTPRLAGQMESYLVVAMKEYQNGTRKSPVMHAMSDVLSLIEIQALAAYYAHQ